MYTHTYAHTHTHAHTHICRHTHLYAHTHTHMHTHTHLYAHTHTHMHTHTHIYAHTHTHTLSPLLLFAPDPVPVPLADAVEEKEEDWEDLRHSLGLCGGRGDTLPGEGEEGRREGGECKGVEGTQTYRH